MTLRENNPFIDADLDIIITTYERFMVSSEDMDSVFIPFRRALESMRSYPESIVNSIDKVPFSPEEDTTGDNLPNVTDPNQQVGENPSEENDSSAEDEWSEKVKQWVSDCVPCTDEFKRTISSLNADFFEDIGEGWDKALNETLDRLKDLDDLLEDSDVSNTLCDLGSSLKGQCVPDLSKVLFILQQMLKQMEKEISLDLSSIDSYLTSALSPIINELASNLDLIDTLALKPIRCVLKSIEYQIDKFPSTVREKLADTREFQDSASRLFADTPTNKTEAEQAADEARRAERERQENDKQSVQTVRKATDRASQVIANARNELNFLKKFKDYVKEGTDLLEDKKDWLLKLIEELVNQDGDQWEKNSKFAKGKIDLLSFISLLKAIIEAGSQGDLSCGSDSTPMNESDATTIIDNWVHPSQSLEIIVDDGNIITRRRDDNNTPQSREPDGVVTGSRGPDESPRAPSNIVVKRPISSCLKKITQEEADQVSDWISQLED